MGRSAVHIGFRSAVVRHAVVTLPRGVSVAETERIPAGDTTRTFTLVAKDDAPPVERQVVKVEGKGGGILVTQTFEITVRAK